MWSVGYDVLCSRSSSSGSRLSSLGQLMKFTTARSVVRASSVHNHGFGKASTESL